MVEKVKIKNIEFLRVLGCLAIILMHTFQNHLFENSFLDIKLYNTLHTMTSNGQKAVDLFFILSGFFFVYKLNTSKSLLEFLKHKIIRLYPVLIFLIILSFIVSCFGIIKFDFYSNLLVLFGVLGTPLRVNIHDMHLGIFWYVSTMLWVLGFLYYGLKHFQSKYINYILAFLIFFSYALLLQTHFGKIGSVNPNIFHIFSNGLLRAIGGIGIGYFIAQWYNENINNIKALQFNLLQKVGLTVAEFCCLYFMINNLMLHEIKFKNDLIFIIDFAIIVILFLTQKGLISQLLNGKLLGNLFSILAKYTYSIYMVHTVFYHILRDSIYKTHPQIVYAHPIFNFIFVILSAIVFGIFTYYFIEKPCCDYFKKKAKTKQIEVQ